MSSQKPFKVVIIGAGIAGLSLAHALSLANIDYVILEKHHEPASNAGAVLFIWQHGARILDQFGLLDKFDAISKPLTEGYVRWAEDGTVFRKNTNFNVLADRFERPMIIVDRQQVVHNLFQNLPEPSKLLTNKRVTNINQDDERVYVHLHDGSVEEGDIVVGSDGIHSGVREHIWSHNGGISLSEKGKFTSEYIGLFGVSHKIPELGESVTHLVHGHGLSILLFTQPERVFWTFMIKDCEKRPYEKRVYSQQEVENMAERFKDTHITEAIKFSNLWSSRIRVGMVPIEEGVLDYWHSGRAVLVGDAAHKMTPDLGFGANLAMENAVGLANILHRELAANLKRHLTRAEAEEILQEYQDSRYKRSKALVELSGQFTRINSQETRKEESIVRDIIPKTIPQALDRMTRIVRAAAKLDYVGNRLINENAKGWGIGVKS